jgi:hypothetical protein
MLGFGWGTGHMKQQHISVMILGLFAKLGSTKTRQRQPEMY